MIKVIFCLRRRPDLSVQEFQRYWLDEHGPLVRSHQAVLGMVRYVQCHTVHGDMTDRFRASRGAPEPYDGVAELWFENWAAIEALAESPAARAAGKDLLEDEKRFIDLANSPLWYAEEKQVYPPAQAAGD